jgi:hypothetical protein
MKKYFVKQGSFKGSSRIPFYDADYDAERDLSGALENQFASIDAVATRHYTSQDYCIEQFSK